MHLRIFAQIMSNQYNTVYVLVQPTNHGETNKCSQYMHQINIQIPFHCRYIVHGRGHHHNYFHNGAKHNTPLPSKKIK